MNRYDFYPGDYLKATMGLTMAQDGAYRRLMDHYYATEQPIPDSEKFRIARAFTESEQKETDWVLSRFFEFDGLVWRHPNIEENIERAMAKISVARKNGRKGGRPKKQLDSQSEATEEKTHWVSSGLTQTEPNPKAKRKLPSPSTSYKNNNNGIGAETNPVSSGFSGDERTTKPETSPLSESDVAGLLIDCAGVSREFIDVAVRDWLSEPGDESDRRVLRQWRTHAIKVVRSSWRDSRKRRELLAVIQGDAAPSQARRRARGPVIEDDPDVTDDELLGLSGAKRVG